MTYNNSFELECTGKYGLHMRPAAVIARDVAPEFDFRLGYGGQDVPANSPMIMMTLGVEPNKRVQVLHNYENGQSEALRDALLGLELEGEGKLFALPADKSASKTDESLEKIVQ